MKCIHEKCHPSKRIYVPTHVDDEGQELEKIKPHYFCTQCGEIEYLGLDRAKNYGYFSNIIGDIRRYLDMEYKKGSNVRITSAILRLIMKELNRIDHFTDRFCQPFSAQKTEVKRILMGFLPGLSRNVIDGFFNPQPPVYADRNVNYYGKYYDDLEEKYEKEMVVKESEEDFSFF